MSHYSDRTAVRISQKQRQDLRPTASGWRFFPNGGLSSLGPPFSTFLEALQWSELADRRRVWKPKDSTFCPLLNSRTGAAGELELAAIPTIVYTAGLGSRRDEEYIARRARLTRILTAYGFQDWRFHYGKTPAELAESDPNQYHGTLAYCAAHCRDHAQFLREHNPPLLVMEDDAEPAWPRSHFVPPAGAARLHIGGDWHGVDLARLLARKNRKDWRRHGRYLWRPYNADWFWEAGMLAFHAVLWLDKTAMLAAADYLQRKTGAVDAVVSELDWKFPAAAPTRCWFWQNDGHNGAWSFDFVPPELRPRGLPKFPP